MYDSFGGLPRAAGWSIMRGMPLHRTIPVVLAIAFLAAACKSSVDPGPTPPPGTPPIVCSAPFRVGFRVVTIGTGRRMGVWYPTSDTEAPLQYASETAGTAARNGAAAVCGLLPVVVFSHGFHGCGTQSVFFTEQAARRGYIVAAPDHLDAVCSVDGTGSAEPAHSMCHLPTLKPGTTRPISTAATISCRRSTGCSPAPSSEGRSIPANRSRGPFPGGLHGHRDRRRVAQLAGQPHQAGPRVLTLHPAVSRLPVGR